ncbi:glycosyltransferase [Paenibacillus polygoni]|uniref:Glycosyltransferase n=1 Tax=Paenibacillus polygoni TaxID=3050112 RepID=A0ABY8X2I7_9BACL|nr:TPR domain-containing glycosyltransferase [Paenibacillus polygoni]WIV18899.1 glycosyltransferase [Paenibacillus polygoni]
MKRKSISLCMIVKDEEESLERCLNSVKNKVDQIVIVDTGSKDRTVEIAKMYTNEVYYFKWIDDFAAARNASIRYATSDYILVLDADEYLLEDTNLYEMISMSADYYFVDMFNLLSYGQVMKHVAIRIFANNKGMFYENKLHEHLNTMDPRKNYTGKRSELTIYHSGYTDEVMKSKEKNKRNLPLMIKEVEEHPTAYNLFNMGKTYMWLGEYDKALLFFKKAYPLSKGLIFLPELITSLSYCLYVKKRYDEGLQVINNALEIFSEEVDMLHMQGRLYMDAGFYLDAIRSFTKCIELGDVGYTVTQGNGSYLSYFRLAEIYEHEYDLDKAYDVIIKALRINKSFAGGLQKFLTLITKANQPNVVKNLEYIFKIESIDDLKVALEVLYSIRSPLLNSYLEKYQVKTEPNVIASAYQYNKKYEDAKNAWLLSSNISEENNIDVLLLAIILQDLEMYELVKNKFNFTHSDRKLLADLLQRNSIKSSKLSPCIEQILEICIERLLVLQEYDIIQTVVEVIWRGSLESKLNVCSKFIEFGFYELAIDLLSELYKEHSNNVHTIELLGDVCFISGYKEDAEILYNRLVKLRPNYRSYERIYKFYVSLEDQHKMSDIIKKIKLKFPQVSWVKAN